MTQITDVYDTLGIDNNIKPFDSFFARGTLRMKYKEDLNNKKAHAKPIYIVETLGNGKLGSSISVYAARPAVDENNDPILDKHGMWIGYKNYTIKYKAYGEDERDNYTEKTSLSRLVRGYKKKLDKKDKHKIKVWDKPLYITNIEYGTDSVTRKHGLGFKDYSVSTGANGERVEEPTGVFICLDDIDWRTITARPLDMLNYIKENKQQEEFANPYQYKLPDNLNKKNPYFHLKW